METLIAEFLPDHHLPYPIIFLRMIGAMICGALVGFERERRDHAAGLRTHILVSLSASVFAIIAIESTRMAVLDTDQARIDPLRVIEAVTAGVAFLAAGLIVFSRGQVHGLTTGAGLWLSGGVGLALGFGFWAIGFVAAATCFVVLGAIGKFMDRKVRRDIRSPPETD
ncbi:MgtC/SapB family protein [Rhizobium helianthi]|uniref:Protein MgtC n=1 Tax=Rhizobium helianthi TaxID=1132695 RepID=A0ABW4M833_9HYPH